MSVLVGREAPDFTATAVINGNEFKENFKLSQFRDKYVWLFFYPLDFTFVCPTEIHAFQDKLADFKRLNCEIIGCSVDSHFSHLAWLQKKKSEGGIQGVTFPLVSDINKSIARDYDVLVPGGGVALRGSFLIDRQGIVRQQTVNDGPLGRNIDESVRLLEALQFTEEHGEVCPANWNRGDKAMKPTQSGLKSFFC